MPVLIEHTQDTTYSAPPPPPPPLTSVMVLVVSVEVKL